MSRPLTFGPLEREILEILWQDDAGCSVRDIFCTLQKRREIAYTTVMTVMNRLVEKGALSRERDGKAHSYTAKITRKDLVQLSIRSCFSLIEEEEDLGFAALQEEFAVLSHPQKIKILKALAAEGRRKSGS